MKIFFLVFVLLAVVLSALPFLDESENPEKLTGLPWQIEIQPDGSSKVFGLQIGISTLSETLDILGSDMELAIVAASGEVGNLEMYYGHYRAGLLAGKLVLQTQIDEERIQRWRDNAVTSEYMASGTAKKYILSVDNMTQVLNETVTGLSFIPVSNLDEEVILARFGEPSKRVKAEGVTHYLYPDKGLVVALHDKSKEVIQYVHPENFEQLSQPLQ